MSAYDELVFSSTMWAYLLSLPMGDGRGLPGEPSLYGNIEPSDDWPDDYYVGQSLGMRGGRPLGSRDIDYGHFYPERLFVYGNDDDGEPLPREKILAYFKEIGWSYDKGFWNPCRVWHGYESGMIPSWHTALRADTNIGRTWGDWKSRASVGLPKGWSWDCEPGPMKLGRMYIKVD